MSLFASPRFLRHVLFADAASCVATGLAQVLFANFLATWLGLPAWLLTATGWFLLAYAAVVAFTASRPVVAHGWVRLFVAGNLAWAVLCVAVLAGGVLSPGKLGMAWILAQAVVVVVLAELQWMSLRRAPAVGWA
ncbi:hypothetical protein [Caenimonas aquaedulcis]|uniref:Integral membrane protein n=1 Tax=Caenimonas aquaedulcis TaxID=2793270 RepID=A0A931H3C3_9BURK|nr:hypothetical protein [Caenimonas aquaedulcis]MBG9387831.1 hypothetical protein [Caenimonas aquaedulcis]